MPVTSSNREPRLPLPSRRNMLLGGAAGALATLAACTGEDPASLGQPVAETARGATVTLPLDPAASALGGGAFSLFSQTDLNFQTLFALGSAGRLTVAGEVLSVVAQANAAEGGASYQSVFDAFVAMGNLLGEKASVSAGKGRTVTARSELLRAAKYYAQALYWVLGTSTPDAEERTYTAMDSAFRKAIALFDVPAEYFEVVDEGGRQPMPVWFFPAARGGGRRPTIIINNGSDGQAVDLLAEGGFDALERGYHVVIFVGPGQGSQLFVHNIAFRHDWEKVLGPIIDELTKRRDVDASKIAVRGISFGGLLVPRAAAFDDRIAAVIADPGSTSTWLDYPEFIREVSKGSRAEVNNAWNQGIYPGADPMQKFALKKTLEIFTPEAHDEVRAGGHPSDWYGLSRTIQQYDLEGVADRITAPTLVTSYQDDTAFKDEPVALYDMLTRAKSRRLVKFDAVQGAQYHCGPMSPQVSNEACWDWLDETFAR